MQITPFLKQLCGYREVRGGYLGPLGGTEPKAVNVRGQRFNVMLDMFDVERDRFPYDDGYFETVLASELIEHMIFDPMHPAARVPPHSGRRRAAAGHHPERGKPHQRGARVARL
jgi:hypothetical protein